MATWLNGIVQGELVPSAMYASPRAAQQALYRRLAAARNQGHTVGRAEVAAIHVWTIRGPSREIVASWWLSDVEHGPAIRALRRWYKQDMG